MFPHFAHRIVPTLVSTLNNRLAATDHLGDNYLKLPKINRSKLLSTSSAILEQVFNNSSHEITDKLAEPASTEIVDYLQYNSLTGAYFWEGNNREQFRRVLVCEFARDLNGGAYG